MFCSAKKIFDRSSAPRSDGAVLTLPRHLWSCPHPSAQRRWPWRPACPPSPGNRGRGRHASSCTSHSLMGEKRFLFNLSFIVLSSTGFSSDCRCPLPCLESHLTTWPKRELLRDNTCFHVRFFNTKKASNSRKKNLLDLTLIVFVNKKRSR